MVKPAQDNLNPERYHSMKRFKKVRTITALTSLFFVLLGSQAGIGNTLASEKYSRVIWNYLETLCDFGPRNPGSEGYRETLDLIRKVGAKYADQVVEHPFSVRTHQGNSQAMTNLELRFREPRAARQY